jgi:hypothetical protein
MPEIITNKEEPYFDDLPPETMDYKYLEYLILMEASGEKVSWKGISHKDVNKMVCKLQDKDYIRGSSINGEPVWAQLKPKGKDRLEILRDGYSILKKRN